MPGPWPKKKLQKMLLLRPLFPHRETYRRKQLYEEQTQKGSTGSPSLLYSERLPEGSVARPCLTGPHTFSHGRSVANITFALLGTISDVDIFLYGLSEALGGGVLLCCGQQRVHFEQRFFPQDLSIAQLPVLYWKDFDGDGQFELAVKYHTGQDESGGCTYDLVFYRPNGETWSAVSASQSFCAEAILKEINTSWNERTNTCTLSCSGQQVLVALPADTAPGQLVIGHLCLFTEEEGQFTVICDAWFPVLSDSAAIFRAQIIYDGISVALQNIHMDSFSGV